MRWVWSLGGLSIRQLARRTLKAVYEEDTFGRAAELSYYFVLSLFPFLICVSSIIGLIFTSERGLYQRVLNYAAQVMPPTAYSLINAAINDITRSAGGGTLSIALLLALWTASSGMDAVINGLNAAYDVREFRPWWRRRIVAIALTVVLVFLLLSALVLLLAGDFLRMRLAYNVDPSFLDPAWGLAQWTVIVVFMLIALSITYLFAPNLREQRWQAILPGALVAFAGWVLASLGFRLYLTYFDTYGRTYGSLGAVVVLLLWLYLSGAALLLGGEVNAQIRHAAAAAGAEEAKAITEDRQEDVS